MTLPSPRPDLSTPSVADLARMIDHSLLHPTLSDDDLRSGLQLARDCGCATACIKPYAVPLAAEILRGSPVQVCAVAGFPHGNSHPEIIAAEATRAIEEGATEIDMVANAGKALGGNWDYIAQSIAIVNGACKRHGAILKVIFENDYLADEHIIRLCQICTTAGVAFVKTSTGYGFVKRPEGGYDYHGATDHHLQLMRQHAGPDVQIKAAGGIRTLDDLLRVRGFGVTRIGATATAAILGEAVRRGYPDPAPLGLASRSRPTTPGY